MNYEFFAQTDAGRVRSNNEDAIAWDAATQIGLVADGMGGYNAGEIASGMAAAAIQSEMTRWLAQAGERASVQDVRRALEICAANANLAILKAANANPKFAGMGTTLVVGVFLRDRLILGHIGDSRCYRMRAGVLTQLTRDHSLLQEQLDAGLISPQEAANSSQRNLVTRALGVEPVVELELSEHLVLPEDVYIMCTDGLTDMVDERTITAMLLHKLAQADSTVALADNAEGSAMAPSMLPALTQQLIDAANVSGGRDNIGVLIAWAHADPKKTTMVSRLLKR